MVERYEPPKKGNSIFDRLGVRTPGPEPPDDASDAVRDAFRTNRPSSDDVMLDVRLSDGSRRALSYTSLLRVDFNPADQLRLFFALVTVVIEGRGLTPLYDMLRRHRANFIQEGTTAEEGLKPDDAAHIDHIHFEKSGEEES